MIGRPWVLSVQTKQSDCLSLCSFKYLCIHRPVQCAEHVNVLRLLVLGVGGLGRLSQAKPMDYMGKMIGLHLPPPSQCQGQHWSLFLPWWGWWSSWERPCGAGVSACWLPPNQDRFPGFVFPSFFSLIGGKKKKNIWKIEIKMQSPRISLFNFFAYYLLIFVLIKITIYMFFWLQQCTHTFRNSDFPPHSVSHFPNVLLRCHTSHLKLSLPNLSS